MTYGIYRDGNSTPIAHVVSNSTGVVTFTDAGLAPGSTHAYQIDAADAVGNTSAQSAASEPITVLSGTPPIFADTFSTGNFSAWTSNTRLTIDSTQGGAVAPSARMNTVAQSASAFKDLPATLMSICMSANVSLATQGVALSLLRLRAPANGPFAKAFVSSAGKLAIRSDFAGVQKVSTVSMPSGWHNLELCGAAGPGKAWDLYLDGAKAINAFVIDTDPAGIARVQIGDTASRTVIANWDDVVVDQHAG